jgi:hypothetical protein
MTDAERSELERWRTDAIEFLRAALPMRSDH